jgi:NTP pyrophosphatase (non-canonical NTP hydrolase)
MSELKEIIEFLVNFRNERDWEQFHNAKNLAIAISIEAAELNELFLWKTLEECNDVDREKIQDEVADIMIYSLFLSAKFGFDVRKAIMSKMLKNAAKYPVNKAKGNAKKYSEL